MAIDKTSYDIDFKAPVLPDPPALHHFFQRLAVDVAQTVCVCDRDQEAAMVAAA